MTYSSFLKFDCTIDIKPLAGSFVCQLFSINVFYLLQHQLQVVNVGLTYHKCGDTIT